MVTFINIFTVQPEKQQQALQNIQRVYQEVVRIQPGFISAELLQSNDGTRVTAVARWESEENVATLRENQRFKELHNQDFFEAIESVEPRFYTRAIEVKRGE
ncbi:putative enzyme involved in biosynthesis of extracellular polysaccharides [Rivularia sp. PCC 7116]|uniref:antibiotic biosynthesis monooxygenase family protein n=1 Tax=Rivularia sp. PCC 7116 TaxID=373994 RepID=UPI00029EC622|nr:antibiotic biosynthesis monooxygenase [Rivularia sp. PCC 7116]AFY54417.1 putative enzyme involved in biosynthesis of extracellular polysaccharides [Rivularia sp. PCC 7116]